MYSDVCCLHIEVNKNKLNGDLIPPSAKGKRVTVNLCKIILSNYAQNNLLNPQNSNIPNLSKNFKKNCKLILRIR